MEKEGREMKREVGKEYKKHAKQKVLDAFCCPGSSSIWLM